MKLLLATLFGLQAACAVEFEDEEFSEVELELTTAYSNDFSVDASGLGFAADKWRLVSYGANSSYLEGTYGNYSVPVLATTWLPSAPAYGTTLRTAAFFGNTITYLKATMFFANHIVFDVVDYNDFKWVRLNKTGSGILCEIGETINGTAYKRRSRTCTTTYTSNQPVPMAVELLGNAVRFTVNDGTDVMYYTYATPIDTARVGMGASYRAAFDYFVVETP